MERFHVSLLRIKAYLRLQAVLKHLEEYSGILAIQIAFYESCLHLSPPFWQIRQALLGVQLTLWLEPEAGLDLDAVPAMMTS